MQTEINYEKINEIYEETKQLKKQIMDDIDEIRTVRKKVKNIYDGTNEYFCENLKKNCDIFEDLIKLNLEPIIESLKKSVDNYKATDGKVNTVKENFNQYAMDNNSYYIKP